MKVFFLADTHSPEVPNLPQGINPVGLIENVELIGDLLDTTSMAQKNSSLIKDIKKSRLILEALCPVEAYWTNKQSSKQS